MLSLVVLFALVSNTVAVCNTACQAYEWAYPIWHMGNLRFAQSAQFGLAPNQYTGNPSTTFHMNFFSNKVTVPSPTAPAALCDATICSGIPYALNPNPIVSPNVDTLYKAAWLDLSIPQYLVVPDASGRYYSILFFDMYTNVNHIIDIKSNAHGGQFCLIHAGDAVGTATCHATHPTATVVALPTQYGWAIVRVYSSGAAATCPTGTGVDGCLTLAGITMSSLSPSAPLSVFTIYKPLMSPVPTSCGYVYGQPPCGTAGNKNLFWAAVCHLIVESPPSAAEAAYINANFASLGIHSTGCTTLDLVALDQGLVDGYAAVNDAAKTAGKNVDKQWQFLPFDGQWASGCGEADMGCSNDAYLLRAVTSARLHAMNPNAEAVYYAAFTDHKGDPLNASKNQTYRMEFDDDSSVPVDYSVGGFWSLTVYDSTYYLNGANGNHVYAIRGASNAEPPKVHIAHTCTNANCIPAPDGPFVVLLRGYAPTNSFQPNSGYELPWIKTCQNKKVCD